jgi:hypothetical protein
MIHLEFHIIRIKRMSSITPLGVLLMLMLWGCRCRIVVVRWRGLDVEGGCLVGEVWEGWMLELGICYDDVADFEMFDDCV